MAGAAGKRRRWALCVAPGGLDLSCYIEIQRVPQKTPQPEGRILEPLFQKPTATAKGYGHSKPHGPEMKLRVSL